MLIVFAAVLAGAVLYLLLIAPARLAGGDNPSLCTHYAHRGLHGGAIPENSLAAFRAAADAGYGIELDIRLSADGEVVVFHDDHLARMTGVQAEVSACTAEALSGLYLYDADGKTTQERIPTLREVLDAVGGRVPLLIELKGESADTALCPAADAILAGYNGVYCVESFNPLLLAWYKKHCRHVLRGQLYTNVFREKRPSLLHLLLSFMVTNVLSRPHFIAYDRRYAHALPVLLTTKWMAAPGFVWTVRTEEEYAEAARLRRPVPTKTIFESIAPNGEERSAGT